MSSTLFETRESQLQRKPVYYAVFPSGPTTFSTHKKVRVLAEYLTDTDTVLDTFTIDEGKTYPETPTFVGVDHSPLGDMFPWVSAWTIATGFGYLHLPTTTSPMQIYPEEGHCSVGAVLLTVEDVDGEATALMATVLFGQEVTVYGGFDDFDIDDYVPLYKGTVQSIVMPTGSTNYQIQLHNTQSLVNKQLFQVASSILIFPMTIDDLDFAIDPGLLSNFEAPPGYVFIEQELIKYDSRGLALFSDLTRGAWGSVAAIHPIDAVVTECFVLGPAHPIDLILDRYYGTASKTCLGLTYDDIDWSAFAAARDILGPDIQMQFFVTSAQNALEWLSRELFMVTGTYPYVNADGKLSIKAFEAAGAATATFDHDSIVENSGIPQISWSLGAGTVGQPINDITINYDLNPVTGEYHSFYRETRPTSIANYGTFPVVMNSSGLRFAIDGTAQFIVDRVAAMLDRYEDGAPVINIRTHLQKQSSDVGEIAALTSSLIPNRSTGLRGVTSATAEIINRSVHWDTGGIDWVLLGADVQL